MGYSPWDHKALDITHADRGGGMGEWRLTVNRHERSWTLLFGGDRTFLFGGDKNILQLDCGEAHETKNVEGKQVNFFGI